jgi:hypothetical protein
MTINTPLNSFRKLFTSDVAPGAIPTLAPTRTQPSGDGVFNCVYSGAGVGFNALKLLFVGSSAADQTFTARVTAWMRIASALEELVEYVPVRLADLTVTLGTKTGFVGGLGTSLLYADTIVAVGTPPIATGTYEIISPADNGIAMVKFDFAGAEHVQVQLGTTATAATANAFSGGF